jgi:hypothetical protein
MQGINEIETRIGIYKRLLSDITDAYNLLSVKDKHRKDSEYQIQRLKSLIEVLEWVLK